MRKSIVVSLNLRHDSGIARQIETALYCRDFEAVHHALLEYSNAATQSKYLIYLV
jgi:hypothetical protein